MIPQPRAIAVSEGTGHVRCRIDWTCGCVTWVWRYLWVEPETPWAIDRVHWCDMHRADTSMCDRGGHAWQITHTFGRPTKPEAHEIRCIHCGLVTTRTIVC